MPTVDFKAFKGTTNKVKLLCFHPTMSWLAFADKGHSVTVLDWASQQVVYEAQISTAEEMNAMDNALLKVAEREPSFRNAFRPSAAISGAPKPAAPGSIKDICFMDLDTCYWQIAQQHFWQQGLTHGNMIPSLGKVKRLRGHRWLVTACESKILLQDLTSSAIIDIPRSEIDSRSPSCVTVLYHNGAKLSSGSATLPGNSVEECVIAPIIAAGTSSGTIYLLGISDPTEGAAQQCIARLVGGHKGAVTKLVAVGGKDAKSPERLLSGASDGTVALWDPSPSASTSKDVSPVAVVKPHDAEILSITLANAPSESPDPGSIRLVTSGEDKRVCIMDFPNISHQIAKWKPLPKGSVNGLAFAAWAAGGPELFATTGERAALWGLSADGRQQEATLLANLDNFLPVGLKKAAKVYTVACHPLQPKVIAVGANSGVGLLLVERVAGVPGAALPASAARGLEYLYATSSTLWRLSYAIGLNAEGLGQQLSADLINKASIAKFGPKGCPEVLVSPCGRHFSLTWPDTLEYSIYTSTGGGEYRQVQSGSGSSVAWASQGGKFAVLHLPQVVLPEARRGRTKKSRARDEEMAAQAAAQAASMAVQEGGHVKVYSISEGGAVAEENAGAALLKGDRPKTLFGGPVLGIVTAKSIVRGGRKSQSMQLYSWKTSKVTGPELLAPLWLSWDPQVTAVALGYPDAVVLCRTQPAFSKITSLPIQATTSGLWHKKMLLIVSATEVHGVFVAADADVRSPFIETMKLASLEGGVNSQVVSLGDATASLPSEGTRPVGPCKIGGIRDGCLWLIGARGQPFVVSMVHLGLQARVAAAEGDCAAARSLIESGIPKPKHDELALFMAALSQKDGLQEALKLSGISLRTELALSRRGGKFRRALRCLQALAFGADDPAAFQELPAWSHHMSETYPLEMEAVGPKLSPPSIQHLIQPLREEKPRDTPEKADPRRSILAFIAADNAEDDSSEDEEATEQTDPSAGLAQDPKEAIDWDALLANVDLTEDRIGKDAREESTTAIDADNLGPQANSAMAGAHQAYQEVVSDEEGHRVAGLLEDGLLLVDAALGFGHQDVAIAALRTLLRGSTSLQPDRLEELLVRCAQCGMSQEIRNFAGRIVTEGTSASPETSALVAALLDDTSLAHRALKSSGMIGLSAVYSHTWKTGNSLQDINDWGAALTAAAGNSVQFAVAPPS